jgi:xanthine phosphoribosyltransferase
MDKTYYNFDEFLDDVDILAKQIKQYNPDALISIIRGGMTLGHFLAEKLNTRNLLTINTIHYNNTKKLKDINIFNIPDLSPYKKIVLVDDISDSGDTLEALIQLLTQKYPHLTIKTATIFYKPTSKVIPDFKIKIAKNWIVFFWE